MTKQSEESWQLHVSIQNMLTSCKSQREMESPDFLPLFCRFHARSARSISEELGIFIDLSTWATHLDNTQKDLYVLCYQPHMVNLIAEQTRADIWPKTEPLEKKISHLIRIVCTFPKHFSMLRMSASTLINAAPSTTQLEQDSTSWDVGVNECDRTRGMIVCTTRLWEHV